MATIYKFTNKVNGKSYVGQTINPRQRFNAHKSSAFNPNSPEYHKRFYRDIRQYGWDNFIYEILEECEDTESKDREDFYIKALNTVEEGYNLFYSGENPSWSEETKKFASERAQFKNAVLDFEDIVYIRRAYLNGKMPSEIYEEYKEILTHYYSFMNIWCGSRYGYIMPEVFEIRPNRVKLDFEKAEEIRALYKEIPSYAKISKIYNIGVATVRDVIKYRTWKPKEPVSTISG
ncbi:GIY-YIG nuclease family protein [Bacillus sp. FJAT-22090]|uniref:GIY-YIG nuclease family protein n=1 Tax=Bacillus sp. FJAT-22090 TaxID=1581038 RepID=UPI0011A028AF|nr:GIY-YIG nuclease family protein [Bacillus sp. FJAT-22090]